MRKILRAIRSKVGRLISGPPQPPPIRPLIRGVFEAMEGHFEVPDVKGTLSSVRILADGDLGQVHRTDFVPGPDYGGMEDNDIRGLLDGTFLYGWNQVGQKYVRAGRLPDVWGYGEYELFRVIQRWSSLDIPARAAVMDVELLLRVGPKPPKSRRTFFLYAVSKDWNPGAGGVDQDNSSAPAKGEVWWNDRRYEEDSWGLPGASADEDVEPAPLASCSLEPGEEGVAFRSAGLTAYVAARVGAGQPVLFLIKLQDRQEDIPGSLVHMWSATEGDTRNPGRKPRLSLFWRAPEAVIDHRELVLEHGRSRVFPVADGSYVGFSPEEGSGDVELSARSDGGPWQPVIRGELRAGHTEVRVRAVRDPIPLGAGFKASFRDTWVRSAAPEDQDVPWTFRSPTGREVQVRARFDGDFTWSVDFVPDEVGRWRYHWCHDFYPPRYESQVEVFDVLIESLDEATRALKWFRGMVPTGAFQSREDLSRWMVRFSKLERQIMALLTPAAFHDQAGRDIVASLGEIRSALGFPVPDPVPFRKVEPPPWQRGD